MKLSQFYSMIISQFERPFNLLRYTLTFPSPIKIEHHNQKHWHQITNTIY